MVLLISIYGRDSLFGVNSIRHHSFVSGLFSEQDIGVIHDHWSPVLQQ